MFGRLFHRHPIATVLLFIISFIFLLWFMQNNGNSDGLGFYGLLSHNAMIALFIPGFTIPLIASLVSIRRYWNTVKQEPIAFTHISRALRSAATLENLDGGHDEGCNFEDKDRFTHTRRYLHHAVMYGFLLCFAATSAATILHYGFDLNAPYDLISLPKLFGISGGLLLSIGTFGMLFLKCKADKDLGDRKVWAGELMFIFLLFFVSTCGLLLYAFKDSTTLSLWLNLHLSSVLTLFILSPYTKMVHGLYRLAALIADQQKQT